VTPNVDMRHFGLVPAALAVALLAPARASSQEPNEQQLIDRLQQIQSEASGAVTGPAQPTAPGGAGADEKLLSEQQVRQRISGRLGVQVLKVDRVEAGGRSAYAVKVMNPPGNYNGAFLVTTLLVDGDTGEVLGQVLTTPNANDPDALPTERRPGDQGSGPELRRRTYR
jgi:hypothetical protein